MYNGNFVFVLRRKYLQRVHCGNGSTPPLILGRVW